MGVFGSKTEGIGLRREWGKLNNSDCHNFYSSTKYYYDDNVKTEEVGGACIICAI
jgi:hypothetical protein